MLAQLFAEAAHAGSGGGMSVKDSDYSCFHWVDCHTWTRMPATALESGYSKEWQGMASIAYRQETFEKSGIGLRYADSWQSCGQEGSGAAPWRNFRSISTRSN